MLYEDINLPHLFFSFFLVFVVLSHVTSSCRNCWCFTATGQKHVNINAFLGCSDKFDEVGEEAEAEKQAEAEIDDKQNDGEEYGRGLHGGLDEADVGTNDDG